MNINEKIKQELASYLEANNTTASAFATKINVNRSSITRFLNGDFSATGKLLSIIAKGMGGKITYQK